MNPENIGKKRTLTPEELAKIFPLFDKQHLTAQHSRSIQERAKEGELFCEVDEDFVNVDRGLFACVECSMVYAIIPEVKPYYITQGRTTTGPLCPDCKQDNLGFTPRQNFAANPKV